MLVPSRSDKTYPINIKVRSLIIRKAIIQDIKSIQKLINEFAREEAMLSRSLSELYENIRDYFIYENRGEVSGVCALHILWENLAEIKSLAVHQKDQKKGIGLTLVNHCISEAKELGIKQVFALTYQPGFFRRIGFREIDKSKLPQKIWGDCLRCPKFPGCDEHAMIIKVQ